MLALALTGATALSAQANPDSERGLPFIDLYPPREYGGHSQIWHIVEDSTGLLYFGNLNEVLIYDGTSWDHIDIPDAAFVRGLAVDAQDTLWIGGTDELGHAKTDRKGQRQFVSLKSHLPPEAREFGEIWRTVITPEGVIFQSTSWLLRWTNAAFQVLPIPSKPRQILTQVGPEAWLSSGGNWQRVRAVSTELILEPVPGITPPHRARVIGAAPLTKKGEFLLATDLDALWRWDGQSLAPFVTAVDDQLKDVGIYAMGQLPDGRFVLNSLFAGVRIFDAQGKLRHHLTDQTGLADNTAISVYASQNGQSIWLGLANGVARVDARPWITWFNQSNGASTSKLYSPVRLSDTLFVPAAAAGILRLNPGTSTAESHLVPEPLVENLINSATVFEDQLILSSTQGFLAWDLASPPQRLPGSQSNARHFFPLQSHPGFWAGLDDDAVYLYQHDGLAWPPPVTLPDLARVRGVVEDSLGTLWAGRTADGVIRATFSSLDQPPQIERLTAPEHLPEKHGWTRFSSDQSGVILGSDVGLLRWNPSTDAFAPAAGYADQLTDATLSIRSMLMDDQAGLWITTQPREARSPTLQLGIARSGQYTPISIPRFTTIDDPSHLTHEPALPGHRPETLWIAGQAALVRLNLDLWRKAKSPPPPLLTVRRAQISDGIQLNLDETWTLPARHGSLQIDFSAPALTGEPSPLFESTLITGSDRVVRTDHQTSRNFDALGSGDYILETRVRHPGGPWSNTVTLPFSVRPVWWLGPGAFIAYFANGALLILVFWELRISHVKRRQALLEQEVQERTQALADQNTELQRLRKIASDETLTARLAAEKAHLEVLRYQLNPHFLFNTLNAICAQIIKSPLHARDTVIQLAEFCRQTLHRPNQDQDPSIGEEVKMLRSYLEIETTRLGELISYSINCDKSLTTRLLPPFLLLPLVENAVKYGAATSDERVTISVSITALPLETVMVEITNTGRWVPPRESDDDLASLGLGLANVKKRLAQYFPDRHEFATQEKDGHVVARITLDYLPEKPPASSV